MKRLLLLPIFIFFLFSVSQAQSVKKSAPPKMLRHVVLFKFKDNVTPQQVAEVEKAFAGLQSKIKTIKAFEFGTNNSPEGLSQGLTHCFVATFASEKDRDEYLPHPAHKEFVEKYAKPYVDKACVVDYWMK